MSDNTYNSDFNPVAEISYMGFCCCKISRFYLFSLFMFKIVFKYAHSFICPKVNYLNNESWNVPVFK